MIIKPSTLQVPKKKKKLQALQGSKRWTERVVLRKAAAKCDTVSHLNNKPRAQAAGNSQLQPTSCREEGRAMG